jgi:Fe-S cluster assembly protein SufD
MSTLTKYQTANTAFVQDAEVFADLYGKSQPTLTAIRKQAMAAFTKRGIPTIKHEEWKYVNLTSIALTEYRTVSPADSQQLTGSDVEQYRYAGKDAILCVIENGKLNSSASSLSNVPKGVRIGGIDDFSNDATVMNHLFTHASYEEEAMVVLFTYHH